MEVCFGRCSGGAVCGGARPVAAPLLPPTGRGPFWGDHAPGPRVRVLPHGGSTLTWMLIEMERAVPFTGSKGGVCSWGGEAHLVRFHREPSLYHHLSAAAMRLTQR